MRRLIAILMLLTLGWLAGSELVWVLVALACAMIVLIEIARLKDELLKNR